MARDAERNCLGQPPAWPRRIPPRLLSRIVESSSQCPFPLQPREVSLLLNKPNRARHTIVAHDKVCFYHVTGAINVHRKS